MPPPTCVGEEALCSMHPGCAVCDSVHLYVCLIALESWPSLFSFVVPKLDHPDKLSSNANPGLNLDNSPLGTPPDVPHRLPKEVGVGRSMRVLKKCVL